MQINGRWPNNTHGWKVRIHFQISKQISRFKIKKKNSPFWMPPEMIRKEVHSFPTDIWSFAICMMELCEGSPPNHDDSLRAMFLIGIGQAPQLKDPEKWSEEIRDFFSRCLEIDPLKRAAAQDLVNHSFCKKADTQKAMEQILQQIFLQESLALQGFIF